jgi:hypothetical protein
MSRRTKRLLLVGVIFVALLALLNPEYSSVFVEGPNGPIRTQQFKFGPGGLFVYTRVVADETTVEIEQR